MRIFIFDSTDLNRAPYLKFYTDKFDEHNIDYIVCSWDKFNNGPLTKDGKEWIIHHKWHSKIFKIRDFVYVAKIIKNIIKQERITHLIIINTIWAMLLRKILINDFDQKYILDIRDYKCELIPGYRMALQSILNHSFFTTVSSLGFLEFLPKVAKKKIIPNHNISNDSFRFAFPTLTSTKRKICIGYLGYVRYMKENEKIIKHIKKSDEFQLYYCGQYAEDCRLDLKYNNQYSNIIIGNKFNNSDKPNLYREIDMIHSDYGNKDISVSTLLPNRLYDAVLFKKPIIVSPKTFLSSIVYKYHLGVAIDLDDDCFNQKLLNYVRHFNQNIFITGCNDFLRVIKEQQNVFLSQIDKFII